MDPKTLIDKAKRDVLSDEELAARLGVKREVISQWRKGKGCSPGTQALLAIEAGLDPRQVALEAIAEKERTPARKAAVRKALQLGAAGLGGLLATACAAIAAVLIGMTPAKASPTCDNVYYVK